MQVSATTEEDQLAMLKRDVNQAGLIAGIANAPAEVFDYYPMTAEQTEAASEIQLTLNNYVKEMTASFLTGKKDIDADWDSFQAELKKIGIDQLQEIYQSAYSLVH